jgi:hypothetical protein
MSPDESFRLAARVEGLFPEVTPQQVSFLADEFASFDAALVDAEVTRFRRHFETLNIASLLRRIGDAHEKRSAPRRPTADREQADARWKQDDERLARLSDEELARRKREVLDQNPNLKRFLNDKDPRQSVVLRSLILNS